MPMSGRRGPPREVDFREVINAARYLVRSGRGWRMLPIHFDLWQPVYGWFRELARGFLFQTVHDLAVMLDRERAGRETSPAAGMIDGQSVRASQAETRVRTINSNVWRRPPKVDFVIEVIRSDDQKGFEVLHRLLGRGTDLRLDDPLATPRATLRKAHRRLSRHDPRRRGWKSRPSKYTSVNFKTDS